MHPESRRQKRKAWLNRMVDLARGHGDKRARDAIVGEIENRSHQVSRAFNEAHRDRETSETIVHCGCHYPLAGLHEGEVLTRGLRYLHPALSV